MGGSTRTISSERSPSRCAVFFQSPPATQSSSFLPETFASAWPGLMFTTFPTRAWQSDEPVKAPTIVIFHVWGSSRWIVKIDRIGGKLILCTGSLIAPRSALLPPFVSARRSVSILLLSSSRIPDMDRPWANLGGQWRSDAGRRVAEQVGCHGRALRIKLRQYRVLALSGHRSGKKKCNFADPALEAEGILGPGP